MQLFHAFLASSSFALANARAVPGRSVALAELDADMAYTQPVIIDSTPDVATRAELDADMAYTQPVIIDSAPDVAARAELDADMAYTQPVIVG